MKSKEVVGQLPLTPRNENIRIGQYLIPLAVDVFKHIDEQPSLFASNVLGEKKNSSTNFQRHLEYLAKLQIFPDFNWYDAENKNLKRVQELLIGGFDKGWLRIDEREVYRSPSEEIEFLATPETLHENNNDRTMYYIKDGIPYSQKTNARLLHEMKVCLLLKLPELGPESFIENIHPNYSKLELHEHFKSFSGRELLISRTSTEKPIILKINNKYFPIDVDFCWIPFIFLLQEIDDISIKRLCVSHRTSKQAALAIMVAKLMGADLPSQITFLPKVKVDYGDKSPLFSDEMLSEYGSNVVKLILLHAIGTHRKDIIIPSSLIHLIQLSVKNMKMREELEVPTEKMLRKFPVEKDIGRTLKLLRTGRVSELDKTILWQINYATKD